MLSFSTHSHRQLEALSDNSSQSSLNSHSSTMKGTATVAALGLSGLASAAICNNNCGRQVAGTAAGKVPLETRRAMCSSFLATTTTVTPP